MFTPEVIEAMLKAGVLSVNAAAQLRATCRTLRQALTGNMPDARYRLRLQPGPQVCGRSVA